MSNNVIRSNSENKVQPNNKNVDIHSSDDDDEEFSLNFAIAVERSNSENKSEWDTLRDCLRGVEDSTVMDEVVRRKCGLW